MKRKRDCPLGPNGEVCERLRFHRGEHRRTLVVVTWPETRPASAKSLSVPGRVRSPKERRSASLRQRNRVWRRDKGMCQLCGTPADPGNWHADHIVPWQLYGPTTVSNLQVAHPACHRTKTMHDGRLLRARVVTNDDELVTS